VRASSCAVRGSRVWLARAAHIVRRRGSDAQRDSRRSPISANSLNSAAVVVPILREYLSATSIIDFGCKHGEWLSTFKKDVGVARVVGLDVHEEFSDLLIGLDEYRQTDLSRPFAVPDRYDLALCIEVAEHLPRRAAAPLVRALTAAAPIVLFSAAIPGQGGKRHLNERPHRYWQDLFASYGFACFDCLRPRIWQDGRVAWWYRQNLFLYGSAEGVSRSEALAREGARPTPGDLDLCHVEILRHRASPSITEWVRQFAEATQRGVQHLRPRRARARLAR
jgi:SAM-dependent methyltransferase